MRTSVQIPQQEFVLPRNDFNHKYEELKQADEAWFLVAMYAAVVGEGITYLLLGCVGWGMLNLYSYLEAL